VQGAFYPGRDLIEQSGQINLDAAGAAPRYQMRCNFWVGVGFGGLSQATKQ